MNFRYNPLVEREIAALPTTAAEMGDRADKALEVAKVMAPVATGAYQRGLRSDSGVEDGKAKGRLVGTDWKSGLIEFGTEKTPAFATIRQAVESTGLRLVKQ